jgi:viroplasmin and RNaseH domain-containing protein
MNASKVVYSSRIKTENNKNMGQGTNEVSKKEYEMRVQTSGNNNEKIIKKVTEVKIKKDKTEKKVEPLRDYEIQNNF